MKSAVCFDIRKQGNMELEKLEVHMDIRNHPPEGWTWEPAEGVGLERGLILEWPWIQRYGDLEESDLIWRFPSLFFTSLLSLLLSYLSFLLVGNRPGTNCVAMGFYHLPWEVDFSRVLDPPKGHS